MNVSSFPNIPSTRAQTEGNKEKTILQREMRLTRVVHNLSLDGGSTTFGQVSSLTLLHVPPHEGDSDENAGGGEDGVKSEMSGP